MNGHSLISPSSAHIWGAVNGCTAYPLMAAAFPVDEGDEAKEGTAAHELTIQLLRCTLFNVAPPSIGTLASNGVVLDAELYEAAKFASETILNEINHAGGVGNPDVNFDFEVPVTAPRINALSNGTPDFWVYNHRMRTLTVVDCKFGWGVVEPFENLQCINYVEGIFNRLYTGLTPPGNITVTICICQPNAPHDEGPVRTWTIQSGDLEKYVQQLHEKAALSLSDNATCNSGPHCRYCPALFVCEAAAKAGAQLFEASSIPLQVNANAATIAKKYELVKRARAHLEHLESAYETELTSYIRKGGTLLGWTIEQRAGREVWAKPHDEILN